MKILSGLFKNRIIKTPKGEKTRPTSSKVRASVFDILQNQIEGVSFLDLFAGSGAIGIEALSRGAAKATFVEKDRQAAGCIRENLKSLKIDAPLLQQEASLAIKGLTKQNETFDIIYVDPPYAMDTVPLLESLSPLLNPEGLILLEQSKRTDLSCQSLQLIDERHFGDTILYFFSAPN